MPKALYRAVWVIKNVYYDGAEWLTERVLLFTSYCFRLIHSAQLLNSPPSSRDHLHSSVGKYSPAPCEFAHFSVAPYLLLGYNKTWSFSFC